MYLGIDPGFTGAWGVVNHHGHYISCGDMIVSKDRINTVDVIAEIRQALDMQDCLVVVEKVHSMPKQGVSSTFKFGMAVGAIQAIVELTRAPWLIVRPQTWKKDVGVTSDKNTSLELARRLWPRAPLSRQKDHGIAEALLLAEWLRRNQL